MDPSAITWDQLSIAGVLGVFVVGFVRGWWVPGQHYRQALLDRDRQTSIAEKATEVSRVLLAHRRTNGGG